MMAQERPQIFDEFPDRAMSYDLGFVLATWDVVKAMLEQGYEGLSAYALWFTGIGEFMGHENFQGHLCYVALPFGEGVPPAVMEFAEAYEARFGETCEETALLSAIVLYTVTDILRKAGTVDDMDKILATMDTETIDSVLLGEHRFCGEELVGINRIWQWPIYIHEWRGEQPRVVFTMDSEEAYALTLEIFE